MKKLLRNFKDVVIQNQLGELIHHFSKTEFVTEEELFTLVQDEVKLAINDNKPHAQALKDVLFGSKITVKALLRMRMSNRVKKYLNIELDNPIRDEVR